MTPASAAALCVLYRYRTLPIRKNEQAGRIRRKLKRNWASRGIAMRNARAPLLAVPEPSC